MRTIASSRRKRTTRWRVRCRLCGTYQAKRFCPAVNSQICPYCCSDMRGTRTACQTCRYNLLNLVSSREVPHPEAKFFNAQISDSDKAGIVDLAMAWEKPDGRLKAMFLLLDFWQRGLKDCFVDVDISKAAFQKRCANMAGESAKEISLNDAKKLIKRALHISNAVEAPIPWDYSRWQSLLGDMSLVPNPTGSLYKCARCGDELNDQIVDVIKKHAKLEDANFYMVCERCAGEFAD